MKAFVDISAWLALNDSSDNFHREALARVDKIKTTNTALYTSDYAIDESLTIIRYRVSHKLAVLFGESVLTSGIVTVVSLTDEDRHAAREMFRRYDDKEFSFTDCTSFALMKRLHLGSAFTFDAHFRQAGFSLL